VVVASADLAADIDALRERAGFRLDRIMPADDPALADLSGHGIALSLRRGAEQRPVTIEVDAEGRDVVLSGGTTIRFVPRPTGVAIPENVPELVVTHASDDDAWVTGRAGMRYRELLPGRWGGRFIASHIHVPGAGPIPDYVHYHRVRFQLIAVKSGEVEVIYEDQGEPFVMRPGDCVLQPPEIRHRVLHSWNDLEVVEVGCPAEHETLVEHGFGLPTAAVESDRDFSGQRFVRHAAADTPAGTWRLGGWTARDSGIASATGGLFTVLFVQPGESPSDDWASVDGEFELLVVMRGTVVLETESGGTTGLAPGDSAALPAGERHRLHDPSDDLELMEVHVP
jgi:quercetin dioxygenase-like cupin family protein